MAKQTLGPDTIQQLIDLRDHHVAEARRCDDALALLGQVSKIAKRAHAVTGKAKQRAAAETPPPTTKRKQRRGEDGAAYYARHKAAKESGRRPTDLIRAVFAKSGTKPIAVETLHQAAAGAGLSGVVVSRVTGIVLKQLVKRREIRRLPGGEYVKHRLTTANDNGAHA